MAELFPANLDQETTCPETSDGYHCGHWYDRDDRACCACGQVNWADVDEEDTDG